MPTCQLSICLAGTTDFIWPNASPSSPLPFPNLNVAISFSSSGLNSSCHLFKESLLTTVACRRHRENKSHPAVLFRFIFFIETHQEGNYLYMYVCVYYLYPSTNIHDPWVKGLCLCCSLLWLQHGKHYLVQSQSSISITLELTEYVPK